MKIDFPREGIDLDIVCLRYDALMNMHMQCEKTRIRREFSSQKYIGFFVLTYFASMIMQSRGVVSNCLIWIIFSGLGVLFAIAMSMILFGSNLDLKLALCAEEGKAMEEKYPSMVNSCYFHALDAVNVKWFRVTNAFRLLPFTIVGFFTALAGVALALKVSPGLASLVGIFSVVILAITSFFLIRKMKKSRLVTFNSFRGK